MKNSTFRRIAGYLISGIIIIVPIAIVFYIVYKVLVLLSLPVKSLFLSENSWVIPGTEISPLGILLLLGFMVAAGWAATKLINEPIKEQFDKWLEKIPLYKSVTDIVNAFVGSKKKFNKPVLVRVSREQDIEVIGFITDEDLRELGDDHQGQIGVYVPMSYSFSGHLIIVPRENVRAVDRNSVDVMKYIVSGGIVELDNDENDKK